MKRKKFEAAVFTAAFVLCVGSVVLSCVTAPGFTDGTVTVNTPTDAEGRIFLNRCMSRIGEVVLIDAADRSRRLSLKEGDWQYNSGTTELTLTKMPPWKAVLVHVRGVAVRPDTFILTGALKDPRLFITLDGRLGIKGFDWEWDPARKRLTFRSDITVEKMSYLIRWDSESGSSSIGNFPEKTGDRDALSYLEAEHDRRELDAFYASAKEFEFLEAGRSGEAPVIVKRAATEREREAMISTPLAVLKNRFGVPDRKLSKELGFNALSPDRLACDGAFAILTGSFIEEYLQSGTLHRNLLRLYELPDGELKEFRLEKEAPSSGAVPDADRFEISRETLSLGLPVEKTLSWGMQVKGFDSPSTLIKLVSYKWREGELCWSVEGTEDQVKSCEAMIASIIAYRGSEGR